MTRIPFVIFCYTNRGQICDGNFVFGIHLCPSCTVQEPMYLGKKDIYIESVLAQTWHTNILSP